MKHECHVENLMNVNEIAVDNIIEIYMKTNQIPHASSTLAFAKKLKVETNFPIRFLCSDEGLKEDGTIFLLTEVNTYKNNNYLNYTGWGKMRLII